MKIKYQENIEETPYFLPHLYEKYLRCTTVLGTMLSIMRIDEVLEFTT